MDVLLVGNDVTPAFGVPCSAPGLRITGLFQALKNRYDNVKILLPKERVETVLNKYGIHLIVPNNHYVISNRLIQSFIEKHKPKYVIFTNSNILKSLVPLEGVKFIYDFFAPKLLELKYSPDYSQEAYEKLKLEKQYALNICLAVIANGEKKLDYVKSFLSSGLAKNNVVNVPFAIDIPVKSKSKLSNEKLVIGFTGYELPWAKPLLSDNFVDFITKYNDKVEVKLLVGKPINCSTKHSNVFNGIANLENVKTYGLLNFECFSKALVECDFTIDLSHENEERKLAYVTRSVVAMCAQVPNIHSPFTEITPLIKDYDAGYIIENENDLLECLERLILSPLLVRSELTKNTQALLNNYLSVDLIGERLFNFLENLK
jgi:hypothetical protein